jgi:hypothetical protein
LLLLGLLLGCGPGPSEVTAPLDGTTGPSTSTASTGTASTLGSPSMEDSTADGSGGATGQGTAASNDSGTTQGVLPETSTGEVASTGEGSSSGLAGTSSGGESSSSTEAPPSCDELYGMAQGYLLCLETLNECHFATITNGGNCNALCSTYGGACIDAFDNTDGCAVIRPDMDTCETNRYSEICVCSR